MFCSASVKLMALGEYLKEYGLDFFHKCGRYKTAIVKSGHKQGTYVELLGFDVHSCSFVVRYANSDETGLVPFHKLEGFVL